MVTRIQMMSNKKYNIIIDTDIGDDIDDTWALSYILSKPEFNVLLIAVTSGDTDYKAKLVATILHNLGRTDIPIVKGESNLNRASYPQLRYVKDDIVKHATISNNYDEDMLNILNSYNNINLFLLGPCNDFYRFYRKNAKLCNHCIKAFMMGGAVHKGYINQSKPAAEYNVLMSIEATNYLLSSRLDFTLLPLDVCRDIIFDGSFYQTILNSESVYAKVIMDNYVIWQQDYQGGAIKYDPNLSSSILYDLIIPFYVLFPESYQMEVMPLQVQKDGSIKVNHQNSLVLFASKTIDTHLQYEDFLGSITK